MKVQALQGIEKTVVEEVEGQPEKKRMPTTFIADRKDMTIIKERLDRNGNVIKREVQEPQK